VKERNKKCEFIVSFIEAVFDFSKMFVQGFARESMHYKSLRLAGYDPNKTYGNLKNLKSRGILIKDKRGSFKFTKKGFLWVEKSAKRYFPFRGKNWDHKWRVIIFDIPKELHNARTKFGSRLKNLGFFMLQKSVFVFPYECEQELGYICKQLKISDYVDVIIADHVGFRQNEIKKHFSL